jgi:serine/threonine protein kinase
LRGLFLIDGNGILQYELVHGLSVGRSTNEVLRVLDALQTGGLCPAGWEAGESTLDPARTLGPDTVIGPYRIDGVVGSGAFGTVLQAWDLMLERRVALKVMSGDGQGNSEAILAEARAAAALNHPNVCTVHSIERGMVHPIIVMEFVDGRPLDKLLEAGAIPPQTAASLGQQIALGMAAAHAQGIVHGDLKPANIIVTADGAAKITDFGLSRKVRSSTSTSDTKNEQEGRTGLSGTPSYMAPELTRGEPATPGGDVFALGLILYEMITGRRAVRGGTVLETFAAMRELDAERCAAELSEPFAKVVRHSLVGEPAQRQITMGEIATVLAQSGLYEAAL